MPTPEERIDKLEKSLELEHRFSAIETKLAVLEKTSPKHQLVILGETFRLPLGPWAAIVLVILFAGIYLIFYTTMVQAPDGRVSAILAAVFQRKGGEIVKDKEQEISTIFTLVTPHEKTLDDLKEVPLTNEEKKYYTLDPGALEAFSKQIMSEGAQGYSRWEAWGQSSKPAKRQWIWNITWSKAKPIKVERLVEIYELHFHRSKGIYIEEKHIGKTLYDKE